MIRADAYRAQGSDLGIVLLHRDTLCIKPREIFFTPEISTLTILKIRHAFVYFLFLHFL